MPHCFRSNVNIWLKKNEVLEYDVCECVLCCLDLRWIGNRGGVKRVREKGCIIFQKARRKQTCPNKDKHWPQICKVVGGWVWEWARKLTKCCQTCFCFYFQKQWPYNWYYLLLLRQRDKEVKETSKSRLYIYLYLWILRWHSSYSPTTPTLDPTTSSYSTFNIQYLMFISHIPLWPTK